MNLIRSLLHLLWMALTVIPWATGVVLLAPFVGKPRLYRICRAWLAAVMHGGRRGAGLRDRVSGLDHLPQDPAAGAACWSSTSRPGRPSACRR